LDTNQSLDAAISTLKAAGVDLDALGARLARSSAAPPLENTAASPMAMDTGQLGLAAALRGCFLPSDLGISTASESSGDPGLAALLAQSEVVTIGTQRAWRLKPETRRDILSKSEGLLAAAAAVQASVPSEAPRDGEGHFLRAALLGEKPDADRLPVEDLEHFATVSDWLGGTGLIQLPSSAELRRKIQQRELLDPFRQLVGRSINDTDSGADRFVGREDELERLRAYVGMVDPERIRDYITRGFSSLWSTVSLSDSGNAPLLVQGMGGMGKSTLIAKFMLDHALIPGVRLPFVYLDFDRAALAPRQPLQLLIDMALQVEAWFPEIEQPLR